jgi:uracil-DNA glycosylase
MSKLIESIGDWKNTPLVEEFSKDYFKKLAYNIKLERMKYNVFPKPEEVFKVYQLTSLKDINVVVLGQDPYPTAGDANGLAFSFNEQLNKSIPKSLANIFKEIETDLGFSVYHDPDLTRWAKQGVFLLNTHLTVREGQPLSHKDFGWEHFTRKTIELICEKQEPIVFMLWGSHAQKYYDMIPQQHEVIMTSHPSPLSSYRGFFGSRCFSRANGYLKIHRNIEINWK